MHFVVPDLRGRPTGGTRYNAQLIDALRARGVDLDVQALEDSETAPSVADLVWVDSLYLHAVPRLARLVGDARLGVIVHYLPSLMTEGVRRDTHALSDLERSALAASDCVLVTSGYLARILEHAGYDRPIVVVEPGSELSVPNDVERASDRVRAVLVAHVVPSKGIDGFLRALARSEFDRDRFELRVVGDLAADPAYASRCRDFVLCDDKLAHSVQFCGSADPERVACELAWANLLVSASRMESFGMALDEARRAGLPIIARDAGNVAAHVVPEAGGELVSDELELAAACARLSRNPAELSVRLGRARARIPPARPWDVAASELIEQLARRGFSVDHRSAGTSARSSA